MAQRIVIVCDQASKVGGHARVAVESAAGLAKSGEEFFYFASHGPVDPELTEAGVNVILTDQPDALDEPNRLYGAFRGIWNIKAKKLLSELIKSSDLRNVVFHIHGWTKSLSPRAHSGRSLLTGGSATTNHELTSTLDRSMGAGQQRCGLLAQSTCSRRRGMQTECL